MGSASLTIVRWDLAVDFERVRLFAQFFLAHLGEVTVHAQRSILGAESRGEVKQLVPRLLGKLKAAVACKTKVNTDGAFLSRADEP